MAVADPIARLVKELARLPGIGEKTAQRLAFHILEAGAAYAGDLSGAITAVVRDVHLCSSCQTLTDQDPCAICRNPERDPRLLCVVEGVPDVLGEATALYLTKLLKPMGIRVTRIAQGVPMGGDLEYADQVTLARALAGRREL